MTSPNVVIPPPVVPGDRIGVAALSGAVSRHELVAGLARLERMGYEPILADNVQAVLDGAEPTPELAVIQSSFLGGGAPYALAGSDEERLDGFHRLLADPSIGAILFARGGHGLLRVLPAVDWELVARTPRSFVGYSDLTPLLGQVVDRLGWQALHGPMVASDLAKEDFSVEEEESLVAALAGDFSRSFDLQKIETRAMNPGAPSIVAPLAGGCLSLVAATLGTEHCCSFSGRILFLEDLNEPDYRIDRMLTHLELSGKFVGISALLIGHMRSPDPSEHLLLPLPSTFSRNSIQSEKQKTILSPKVTRPLWLQGLVEASNRYGWPIFSGLAAGHGSPNLTLPLGRRTRIDVENGLLTFL